MQNYIFNEFWYSPAYTYLTFLFSLMKSDFISPQDKSLSFLYEMILHNQSWNRDGKHQSFIFQYYIVTA